MSTATLHVLPACDSIRVFEVRRLAIIHGCAFAGRKPSKPKQRPAPAPFDPNDGGRAA